MEYMRLGDAHPAGASHQSCIDPHRRNRDNKTIPSQFEQGGNVTTHPIAKLRISSFAARAYERAAFYTLVLRNASLPLHVFHNPRPPATAYASVPAFCTWLPQPWTI
jgi:hypothetical protein